MNFSTGISKKPSENPSLNFNTLREEGVKLIQSLSGKIWTDFNLHDPGVTTLEVLCYALTDLGYRTEQLLEAFEGDEPLDSEFINQYFFNFEELLSHLPLTKLDFENFIEENHSKVLSAWFEAYPLLTPSGMVRGGYEVTVLLESHDTYGNLNSDFITVPLEQKNAVLEVIFFYENNQRIQWGNFNKINSCKWKKNDPDSFFIFEKFNCQAAITLGVTYHDQKKNVNIPTKARITFNPEKPGGRKSNALETYQKLIIKKLESVEFLEQLNKALSKEQFKSMLLNEIKLTLLPCRNLCEDFIKLRVVNEQEIKIDAEIILDDFAPIASKVVNKIYDRLDTFLLKMMVKEKDPASRSKKNILYASNLIEEMVKEEGVEGASIISLNLFVDGVPTIPLNEEASFECIHLQSFNLFAPKLSREKSSVTFVRSGTKEKPEPTLVSKEFVRSTHLFTSQKIDEVIVPAPPTESIFKASFFESLRAYQSIQDDFPENYRLREKFSEKTDQSVKLKIGQFKGFLTFFERVFIGYLEQLYSFHDMLSVRQSSKISENELQILKRLLPDLEGFSLLDESKWSDDTSSEKNSLSFLLKQHKILDHLLARFATTFITIAPDVEDRTRLEKSLEDKKRLLKDIPIITRERGLGIAIKPQEADIWDSDLLSGFQKRVYRLLGINSDLKHFKLSERAGSEPVGFYLVEHILLIARKEDMIFNKKFNRAAELLLEFLTNLLEVEPATDPFSFQMSIVLPDWYSPWRQRKNSVELEIRKETPAHILPYFHWMNKKKLAEFEILYEDWVKTLLQINRI